MEYVRFVIASLFILFGLFVSFSGIIGFYKYKYILNRMHSSALIDTLGIFFILLGLIIARGFTSSDGSFDVTSIKLICILAFLWITSPISSHMISRLIYLTDSATDNQTIEIEVEESENGGVDHERN